MTSGFVSVCGRLGSGWGWFVGESEVELGVAVGVEVAYESEDMAVDDLLVGSEFRGEVCGVAGDPAFGAWEILGGECGTVDFKVGIASQACGGLAKEVIALDVGEQGGIGC